MTPPLCASHRAFIYERGGVNLVGELPAVYSVQWNRRRDDISQGMARIGSAQCCDIMRNVRTVAHELHIIRGDDMVWQGPITRLEYEWDNIGIFAEDILWVLKRRVQETGWNLELPDSVPGVGVVAGARVTAVDLGWLVAQGAYQNAGDAWNMTGRVRKITTPVDQRTFSKVNPYQFTVWQVLDDFARYYDLDYTVLGRDVYIWDVHTNWVQLATLTADHMAEFPRIVEYGNQYGNRYFRTDGSGYAGIASSTRPDADYYGWPVDVLSNATNQEEEVPTQTPTARRIQLWQESAEAALSNIQPPPVSLIVPANSTLMPGSPWDVNRLMAGSWVPVAYDHACRSVREMHKLQDLTVTENGGSDEEIKFTTLSAPQEMIMGALEPDA